MSKKKLVMLVTSLIVIGTMLIGGTLAYFTDQDTAENVITLGKVDGELEEPKWDEANPDGEIKNIVPGDKIVKDPILTVAQDSQKAYVRFKVAYEGLTAEQFAELKFLKTNGTEEEEATFDADGYFYVQKIMEPGEIYQLFDYVVIPKTWKNDMALKTFKINITAELVQADNFEPVKTGDVITGWGEVEIEQYTAE